MNTATDTMIDVCVRWNIFEGHYYVGPFASADEAAD
jgi:hypothetical protein